jgi:hypothetical protein
VRGPRAAPLRASPARRALLATTPPGLAAVLAHGGLPSARVALVGMLAALAGSYAVFSLRERLLWRAAARGGSRGPGAARLAGAPRAVLVWDARRSRSQTLPLAGLAALAALGGVLALTLSPLCLAFYGIAVGLEALGCLPSLAPILRTAATGLAAGAAGLAGWSAVASLSPRALTVVAFLLFWAVGCCDIADGLAQNDGGERSPRSLAAVHGPVAVARAAGALGFVTLVATIPLPTGGAMLNDLALVAGVLVVAWPGARLWHRPGGAEAAAYFDSASLYPAVVLCVALLPLLERAL